MKTLFDLTPLYDHLTGIERYNMNITREVIRNHPEDDYVLLFKEKVHEAFKDTVTLPNVSFEVLPACGKLRFIQIKLLNVLKKTDADCYVFLSFTSPVLFGKGIIINAIHDLTCWDCPESLPLKMKYYYRAVYRAAVRKSRKIVTVSEFSQRRICEKYALDAEKVPVVYDGLSDIFYEVCSETRSIREKYGLPERYLLSLSTLEPRKNLGLLIEAYTEMTSRGAEFPDLVLAGREGWKTDEMFRKTDAATRKRIHFTGFVDDNDLPALYRGAEAFIFPSMYEGFGLPVIEAMSQGTLTVSSDAASLPEIAGDAGILFESGNMESLERALEKLYSLTDEEKKQLIAIGIEKSHSYSWTEEAEKLHEIMLREVR